MWAARRSKSATVSAASFRSLRDQHARDGPDVAGQARLGRGQHGRRDRKRRPLAALEPGPGGGGRTGRRGRGPSSLGSSSRDLGQDRSRDGPLRLSAAAVKSCSTSRAWRAARSTTTPAIGPRWAVSARDPRQQLGREEGGLGGGGRGGPGDGVTRGPGGGPAMHLVQLVLADVLVPVQSRVLEQLGVLLRQPRDHLVERPRHQDLVGGREARHPLRHVDAVADHVAVAVEVAYHAAGTEIDADANLGPGARVILDRLPQVGGREERILRITEAAQRRPVARVEGQPVRLGDVRQRPVDQLVEVALQPGLPHSGWRSDTIVQRAVAPVAVGSARRLHSAAAAGGPAGAAASSATRTSSADPRRPRNPVESHICVSDSERPPSACQRGGSGGRAGPGWRLPRAQASACSRAIRSARSLRMTSTPTAARRRIVASSLTVKTPTAIFPRWAASTSAASHSE